MLELNYLSVQGPSLSLKISPSHLIPSGHPLYLAFSEHIPTCFSQRERCCLCTRTAPKLARGWAVPAQQCRVPATREKWQCKGWESHGKYYWSLFLMSIFHRPVEPSSEGSLGWVQCLRPKWDCWGLRGSAWPQCLRTRPRRAPNLGFLSSGCFGSALRDMQWLKQNRWSLPEQFLSPCALLQGSARATARRAAPAHKFLPQFPH